MAKGHDRINLSLEMEAELRTIMAADPDGLLKLSDVVDRASDPANPLHRYFEWDDTVAARKWRLEQARVIVSSLTVYNEALKIKVRALSSLEVDRMQGGGYRWTMDVMERVDLREELLATALAELNRLASRYKDLQELSAVWGAVEAVSIAETDKTPITAQ